MSQRLHPTTPANRAHLEYERAMAHLADARDQLTQSRQEHQQSELNADGYRRQLHLALFLCACLAAIIVMWGVA